mgnify:CR=1 FL=1
MVQYIADVEWNAKIYFRVNHSSNSVCQLASENCSKKGFLFQKAKFLFFDTTKNMQIKIGRLYILKIPVCPPFLLLKQ